MTSPWVQRELRSLCGLCGNWIGDHCDGTEASHDGDGNEPCGPHGHYGCSTNGRSGGPCGAELRAQMTRTCDECGRAFDLTDESDANEWTYGHDCEVN